MRYQIAFYYQNKFGVSDQVEVLRCLFQLSCMPPDERNPDELHRHRRRARSTCDAVPGVLREVPAPRPPAPRRGSQGGRQRRPHAGNRSARRSSARRRRIDRAVPPRQPRGAHPVQERARTRRRRTSSSRRCRRSSPKGRTSPTPARTTGDDFSAFKAARAWFTYACVPLPPNPLRLGEASRCRGERRSRRVQPVASTACRGSR